MTPKKAKAKKTAAAKTNKKDKKAKIKETAHAKSENVSAPKNEAAVPAEKPTAQIPPPAIEYFLSNDILRSLLELAVENKTQVPNPVEDREQEAILFLQELKLTDYVNINFYEHEEQFCPFFEITTDKAGAYKIGLLLKEYAERYKSNLLTKTELSNRAVKINKNILPFAASCNQVIPILKRWFTEYDNKIVLDDGKFQKSMAGLRLYEILIALSLEGFISFENDFVELKKDLDDYKYPIIYKCLSIKDNAIFNGKKQIVSLTEPQEILLAYLFRNNGKVDLAAAAKAYGYKPNRKNYGEAKVGDTATRRRDAVRDLFGEMAPKLLKNGFKVYATKKDVSINYVESTEPKKKSKPKTK